MELQNRLSNDLKRAVFLHRFLGLKTRRVELEGLILTPALYMDIVLCTKDWISRLLNYYRVCFTQRFENSLIQKTIMLKVNDC